MDVTTGRWAFPRRASSASEARAATRRFLASLREDDPGARRHAGIDEEAAVLAVSELVSNAVLHASAVPGEIQLRLEARGGTLRIEVEDCDPRPPVVGPAAAEHDRGRGLLIVDRLSARWGWSAIPENGKSVWCDLAEVSA